MIFSDVQFLNLINFQTIYVLKTCICMVALYRVVGIVRYSISTSVLSECDVSFKVSTIDANEQHSCQKLAIFTVLR